MNASGARAEGFSTTCAVVLNWNQADLTVRCVRDLLGDGLEPSRIVVVDNGSSDDSTEQLERDLPAVRHLFLPENIGYARASNAGARELPDAQTYIFVNNDAFVHVPGTLERLVASLEREGIGVAVPRLRNEDLSLQPSVVPLSSPATAFVRATGLSRFIPNRWQPRWSTHWNHNGSRTIDAAAGTVVAIRGDLFRQLGGYAEREFMYSEDIDLCWRTRKAGCQTWFEASAEFVHLGNASGRTAWTNAERAEMVARSDASMIREELGRTSATATIGFLLLGLVGRLVFFRLIGDRRSAVWTRATLRGYLTPLDSPDS